MITLIITFVIISLILIYAAYRIHQYYQQAKIELKKAKSLTLEHLDQQEQLNKTINFLQQQRDDLKHKIWIEETKYKNAGVIAQQQLKLDLEKFKNNSKAAADNYFDCLQQDYKQKQHIYDMKMQELQMRYDEVNADLHKIEMTRAAAQQAVLREEQIKRRKEFYTMSLDMKAKHDIDILSRVEDELTDPRPIRMVIWNTYYSKKVNEMCAKILGANKTCGIYKITYQPTNQCYIGQSVDIKQRWRQHIKAGTCKIDTPTGNKLYEVMAAAPISDFTFEVLQKCNANELDEKEAYYIKLYQSYQFGYNSTKGNKK